MKELLKNISPLNNRREMPKAQFVMKKILAFWLCYIGGLFLAEGAVILLHFAAGKNMLVGDVFASRTITLITYYGYAIVAGVTLLYWKWVEKKSFAEMGLSGSWKSFFAGALLGGFLLALSVSGILLTGSITCQGVFDSVDLPGLLLLAGGFLVQGATEELLCRGLVFHALKEKISPAVAGEISAILFLLPHLPSLLGGGVGYDLIGIVNLLLISTIFTQLTTSFRSIWAACGLHAFWNFGLYGIFGLNVSGSGEAAMAVLDMRTQGESIWNGGTYGIEASILTTAVLAVATLGVRKRRK